MIGCGARTAALSVGRDNRAVVAAAFEAMRDIEACFGNVVMAIYTVGDVFRCGRQLGLSHVVSLRGRINRACLEG